MFSSHRIGFAVLVFASVLSACANPAAPTALPASLAGTDTPAVGSGPIGAPLPPTAALPAPVQSAATWTAAPPIPAGPAPTIVYSPHFNHVWDKIPAIVIVAKQGDPRIQEVYQAVDFWNQQLPAMGTPFRLGAVTVSYALNPDDLVPAQFRNPAATNDPGQISAELPQSVMSLPGEIIVTLTSIDLTSRNVFEQEGGQMLKNGRDLILVRNFPASITSKNATGALMHEFGHAVGLAHDSYPTSVMCGGPWMSTCRQREIILDADKQYILSLYPSTWTPAP